MGKLLYLPGCKPKPSQVELVNEATTILMIEVASVFIQQRQEQGKSESWFNAIQKFLWSAPLRCDEHGRLLEYDIKDWKHYWRGQALEAIATRRR